MNDRYKKAVDFIQSYIEENGWPPTVREIGAHMGLKSSSSAQVSHRRPNQPWLHRPGTEPQTDSSQDKSMNEQELLNELEALADKAESVGLGTASFPTRVRALIPYCRELREALEEITRVGNDAHTAIAKEVLSKYPRPSEVAEVLTKVRDESERC